MDDDALLRLVAEHAEITAIARAARQPAADVEAQLERLERAGRVRRFVTDPEPGDPHTYWEPAPPLNEVQIRGGPRDGEWVPYVGRTMTDGGQRYAYRRVRHDSGGSSHRYVLTPPGSA